MNGNFKLISIDQRKTISSMVKSSYKLKDIANALSLDPTSVSKEVKRNRDKLIIKNNASFYSLVDCLMNLRIIQ